ncbi:MAG TPA: CbiX/SirB N-terminal domain-containing protein [Asanoa sp.]
MTTTGPLVLVAHGSRDPRAALANHALARAVSLAAPGTDVRVAFLDHAGPRLGQVLFSVGGAPRATVVPLLLTSAYHGQVDIPAALAEARAAGLRLPVAVADVLGPVDGSVDDLLLAALRRRLLAADAAARVWSAGGPPLDGVVLAAAGTRSVPAQATVSLAASALGRALRGVPCSVAYASAAGPTGAEAVASLRAAGARRVGVASYFLAPGLLYESVTASARGAGAAVVAEPLGAASELARLVLARAATARLVCFRQPSLVA